MIKKFEYSLVDDPYVVLMGLHSPVLGNGRPSLDIIATAVQCIEALDKSQALTRLVGDGCINASIERVRSPLNA